MLRIITRKSQQVLPASLRAAANSFCLAVDAVLGGVGNLAGF
jgi:hypothetical protein